MKHRLPCELIQDLFPSYIDGLTSDVTNELLEEHIKECPICCEILGQMQETTAESVKFEEKKEIDFLKKTKKRTRKIIVGSVIGIVIIALIVIFMRFYKDCLLWQSFFYFRGTRTKVLRRLENIVIAYRLRKSAALPSPYFLRARRQKQLSIVLCLAYPPLRPFLAVLTAKTARVFLAVF